MVYQKLGPKIKLSNGNWAYGNENDKFAVHRITLDQDPGTRLIARFCKYTDGLHNLYSGSEADLAFTSDYDDCLAGDFVSRDDTVSGRKDLLHSTGGSVEIPGNGQKATQKWFLRIAPSDSGVTSFKLRLTENNDEIGWAVANKILWVEIDSASTSAAVNDKANRVSDSVALKIEGRRLSCPSGMELVNGSCAAHTPTPTPTATPTP